ncbi:MAG: hypothetical protein WC479_03105 [Candidatus Izemoplasmatales bacterium]
MKLDNTKSKIYNICLSHINTVNSFVDDEGINRFERMVHKIEQWVNQEVIGSDEAWAVVVNNKTITRKPAGYRNLFRKEMRQKLLSPVTDLKVKEK